MAEFNEQSQLPHPEQHEQGRETELTLSLAIQGQEKTFQLGQKLVIESDTPVPSTEEEKSTVEQSQTTGFEIVATKNLPREVVTNDSGISTEYALYRGELLLLDIPAILVDRSKPWNRDAGALPYLDLKQNVLTSPKDIQDRFDQEVSFFVTITENDELLVNTIGNKHSTTIFGFGEARTETGATPTPAPEAEAIADNLEVAVNGETSELLEQKAESEIEELRKVGDTALDASEVKEPLPEQENQSREWLINHADDEYLRRTVLGLLEKLERIRYDAHIEAPMRRQVDEALAIEASKVGKYVEDGVISQETALLIQGIAAGAAYEDQRMSRDIKDQLARSGVISAQELASFDTDIDEMVRISHEGGNVGNAAARFIYTMELKSEKGLELAGDTVTPLYILRLGLQIGAGTRADAGRDEQAYYSEAKISLGKLSNAVSRLNYLGKQQ